MHGIGSSSAEGRPRRPRWSRSRRAIALVLSWVTSATTVWGATPLPTPVPDPRPAASAVAFWLAPEPSTEPAPEPTPEASPAQPLVAAEDTPTTDTTCQTVFWGPRRFTRTTGAPNVYTEAIAVPASVHPPYVLRLVNGEMDGRNRVSSATVKLDGVAVAVPSDFSQQVAGFDRTVALRPQTALEVTLASKPASFLLLSLCGREGDSTPPTIRWTGPTDGQATNDATPRLAVSYDDVSAAGEPASGVDTATLTVTLDGQDTTSWFTRRTGDASGDVPDDTPLAAGSHTLVARVGDRAGNVGTASATFAVDLTPPTVSLVEPSPGAYLKPPVIVRVRCADDTGLDAASLRVLVSGADLTSRFACGAVETPAVLDLGSGLVDGANQVEAHVRDRAGNESVTAVAFNVDTKPPAIHVDQPADGSRYGSPSIEALVRYSDDQVVAPASFAASVDGVPVALAAGDSTATGWVTVSGEGAHAITARVSDRAGNESQATVSFRVDTTQPTVVIARPAPGSFVRDPAQQLVVTYADTEGVDTATVRAWVNGTPIVLVAGPDAAWADLAPGTLREGANRIEARVKDVTGLEGAAVADFVLDTAAPAIAFRSPAAVTNAAIPTVAVDWSDAGSGIDAATGQVRLDGSDVTASLARTALGAEGALASVSDGGHELLASVHDLAGNVAQRSFSFTVDRQPPVLTVAAPAADSFRNERRPELRVTWSDGAGTGVADGSLRVFLRQSDGPETDVTGWFTLGEGEADGRVPDSAALADGTWRLRVVATDGAGNAATTLASFEVDTVPPVSRIEVPADGAAVGTTTPAFDVTYSDDRTGIDPGRFALLVDDQDRTPRLTWGATRATGALTSDEALGEGDHTAELRVFDRAGNGAASAVHRFRVDTTPPTATVDEPAAGSFVPVPTPVVRVTFADPGARPSGIDPFSLRVEVDGVDRTADFTVADGRAEATLAALLDGPHTIVVRVADAAGNAGQAGSGFVVDTTPPAVHDVSLADDAWVAQLDEGRLAISGRLDDLDPTVTVRCQVGATTVDAAVSGGSFSCSVPLTEGTSTVQLTASDRSGHTTTSSRTVNVDTTAPVVRILDPVDGGYTNAATLAVAGTVSDRSPVQVEVLGVPAVVTHQDFAATGVPVGDRPQLVVRATATDRAGNKGTHEVTLHVDRVAPVVHVTRPLSGDVVQGSAVEVEGTFSDESPVSVVYVNGEPATLVGGGSGTGQFRARLTAPSGALAIEAAAHDAAGNVGRDTIAVQADASAPAITVGAPAPGTATNGATIRVAGTVADESRVTLAANGAPVPVAADGSFEADVPLRADDGTQSIVLVATDAAGNASTASVDVTVDRTPPEVDVAVPADGATIAGPSVVVQGVVRDAGTVAVTVDGVHATVNGAAWTVTIDSLPDGPHAFQIVAQDAAGNSVSRTRSVEIGAVLPTIQVDAPASSTLTREATVVVTGAITPPGATVRVNAVAATVTGGSFTAVVPLVEGDNTVRAVVEHPASHRTAEASVFVTRDSTPPVVSVSAPEVISRERAAHASAVVTDNLALDWVEMRFAGGVPVRFAAAPYEIDLALPGTAHSGDTLTLTVTAADRAGNTAAATRGVRVASAGVVVGQVLAAATGRPMPDATVRIVSGNGGVSGTTDERGRFVLPAEDAQTVLTAERTGFTSVDRVASVTSGVGNVVVDARLTELAAPVAVDAAGGVLTAPGLSVAVPARASAASFSLTPLGGQDLPGLLPLGFSPVVAFDLRTDASGWDGGPLTLDADGLPASPLHLVAYRPSTHAWVVVARELAVAIRPALGAAAAAGGLRARGRRRRRSGRRGPGRRPGARRRRREAGARRRAQRRRRHAGNAASVRGHRCGPALAADRDADAVGHGGPGGGDGDLHARERRRRARGDAAAGHRPLPCRRARRRRARRALPDRTRPRVRAHRPRRGPRAPRHPGRPRGGPRPHRRQRAAHARERGRLSRRRRRARSRRTRRSTCARWTPRRTCPRRPGLTILREVARRRLGRAAVDARRAVDGRGPRPRRRHAARGARRAPRRHPAARGRGRRAARGRPHRDSQRARAARHPPGRPLRVPALRHGARLRGRHHEERRRAGRERRVDRRAAVRLHHGDRRPLRRGGARRRHRDADRAAARRGACRVGLRPARCPTARQRSSTSSSRPRPSPRPSARPTAPPLSRRACRSRSRARRPSTRRGSTRRACAC